jgi:MOSC domain-containing protein YiiM
MFFKRLPPVFPAFTVLPTMKILSINVAAIGSLFPAGDGSQQHVPTAYDKRSVSGAVQVDKLGLAGDQQADLTVHGGADKAVYAYPFEHYAFWSERRLHALKRELPLPPGSLGENLTIEGLMEKDVWIGDELHVGDVIFSVTEPRQPCFKFTARMGFAQAGKLMMQGGATGFYLNVIRPGVITAGDAITLIPGPRRMSIDMFNERRRSGRQPDLF